MLDIAGCIDHTILKPDATLAEIIHVCKEATSHRFAAVCVPPYYVKKAKELTSGANVRVATVIGFPFGYSTTASKLKEIKRAIADGAVELDMVHNLTALKAGDWEYMKEEVTASVAEAHKSGRIIKIIVESGILSKDELLECCKVYGATGIDFMKTSTGYANNGATVDVVRLMHAQLPAHILIKASGGIRTFAFAKELIDAGAARLGCSASVKIMEEASMLKSKI